MNCLPAAIILHVADDFLLDVEALMLACSSRMLLASLRPYRIKSQLALSSVLLTRGPAASLLAAASTDQSETSSEPASQWRIGRVMNVMEARSSQPPRPLPLLLGALPSSVTRLRVEREQPIGPCRMPPLLKSLVIDSWGEQWLREGELPSSLIELAMESRARSPLAAGLQLPPCLTRLHLGRDFNQSLPPLPDSLQELELGCSFNQSLPPHPPASLRTFILRRRLWSHTWPAGWNAAQLRTLSLGCSTSDLMALQLPSSLTDAQLNIENLNVASLALPSRLKRLRLVWSGGPIRGSLALQWAPGARVECLDLCAWSNTWLPNAGNERLTLPALALYELRLPRLRLPRFFAGLDGSSEEEEEKEEAELESQPLPCIDWPVELHTLVMHADWAPLLLDGHLPPSLQRLELERYSNQDLPQLLQLEDCRFPSGLTSLSLANPLREPISSGVQWPPHLARLDLSNFGSSLDEWQPPPSLTHLNLSSFWNLATLRCPPNLRVLQLGPRFNQSLEGLQLPASLTHLRLGSNFSQSLQPLSLLPHLQRLDLIGCSSVLLSGSDWTLPALREVWLGYDILSIADELSWCPHRRLSPGQLRSLPVGVTHLTLQIDVHQERPFGDVMCKVITPMQLRQHIDKRMLPMELQKEEASGCGMSEDVKPALLPPSLRWLCIRVYFYCMRDWRIFDFDLTE